MVVDQIGVNRPSALNRNTKVLSPDRLPCCGVMSLDIVGHGAMNGQVASFPIACFDSGGDQRGGLSAATITIERNGEQPTDAFLTDRCLGKDGFMKIDIGTRGFEAPLGYCDRHIRTPLW